MYVYAHIYTQIHVHIHTYVHMYPHIHLHVHVCIYVRMHRHARIYIPVYEKEEPRDFFREVSVNGSEIRRIATPSCNVASVHPFYHLQGPVSLCVLNQEGYFCEESYWKRESVCAR